MNWQNYIYLSISIITNILVLQIWFYIISKVFRNRPIRHKYTIALTIGIISVATILGYTYISPYIHSGSYHYLIYFVTIFLVITLHRLFIGARWKLFWKICIIFGLMSVYVIVYIYKSDYIAYIYTFITIAIAASAEEILKYSLSQNYSADPEYAVWDRDIVMFALVAGLGFGFVENLVYMYYHRADIGLNLTRSIVGYSVHALFTSMAGYISYRGYTVGGWILGVSLHILYNVGVDGSIGLSIFVWIASYYWIAYLIYTSDDRYCKGENLGMLEK